MLSASRRFAVEKACPQSTYQCCASRRLVWLRLSLWPDASSHALLAHVGGRGACMGDGDDKRLFCLCLRIDDATVDVRNAIAKIQA